jgi:hypothetical protein
VEFGTLVRLQVDIKDVNDKTFPLFFYASGGGSELSPSLVQKGYTVAILYAQYHGFAFSEPGFRHEDPARIKVRLQFHQAHIF